MAIAGFGSKAGIVLASVPGVTNGETPGAEEGPFWVDGQVKRVDMRPDSVTGVYPAGLPLYLGLTVSQLSDTAPYTIKPLVGARVDMWNANAQGVYSDESSESTTGTDYQRGYQTTNSHGVVNILTNYSGWYSGRTPHIHLRIRTYDTSGNVTYNYCTQLFFDDTITAQVFANNAAYARTQTRDAYNNTDRVFAASGTNGSPASEAGDYLLMKLAQNGTKAVASFHVVMDLSDTTNADPTGGVENTGTGGGTAPTGGGGTPPTGGGGGGTPPSGSATPTIKTTTTKNTTKNGSSTGAKSVTKRKS